MGEAECNTPVESSIGVAIGIGSEEKKRSAQSSILTILHAGHFRMSLSLGSQALLWKILSESQDTWHPLHRLPLTAVHLLWSVGVLIHLSLCLLYLLRCFFHFQLVKAEFSHHIGVNYLFAPWVSWLIFLQSAPMIFPHSLQYLILCSISITPLVMLDIKIYGQWFTTARKFLSATANPTSLISVIANLVGARATAQMGWKETALCLLTLGLVHYLVLFVTLYQQLAGGRMFPVTLRPTFFLFFAAPSMACLAWNSTGGAFDTSSRMLFYLSLFLFASLVITTQKQKSTFFFAKKKGIPSNLSSKMLFSSSFCPQACRPSLFRKSMRKFNVAWWAYSFPLTFLALASAEYANEVRAHMAAVLMLVLSALSVVVFFGLMLLTIVNTERLFWGDDSSFSFYN